MADATPAAVLASAGGAAALPPQQPKHEQLRVFISYSRDDLDFADQLYAALALCGFDARIDRHGISGGEDWKNRLGNLIREADTICFVLSPSSAGSHICLWEVEEAARLGKRILPVVCRPLDGAQPPPRLQDLNYIFFYANADAPGSGFGTGLTMLTTALNTDLDWLRELTRLLERATEWDNAGRAENRMLSGDQIAEAKTWAARRPKGAPEPTALHLDYIRASEAAERMRQSAEAKRLADMAEAQTERAAALAEAETALKEAAEAQQERARARLIIAWGAGAAAVVLAVVAALAVMKWHDATAALVKAEQQSKRAERAVATASDVARSLIADFTNTTKDGKDLPKPAVKNIVDKARGIMDTLVAAGETSPESGVAYGLERRADLDSADGDKAGALAEYEKALVIRQKLAIMDPGTKKTMSDFVGCLRRTAGLLKVTGDVVDAVAFLQQAANDAEERAKGPLTTPWQLGEISILQDLVTLYLDDKVAPGAAAALPFAEKATSIAEHLDVTDAGDQWEDANIRTLVTLTMTRSVGDDRAAAVAASERLLAFVEKRAAANSGDRDLQQGLGFGLVFGAANRFVAGDREGALASFDKLVATLDPDTAPRVRPGGAADFNLIIAGTNEDFGRDALQPLANAIFEMALITAEKRASAVPDDANRQAYLANNLARMARVKLAKKDQAGAFALYDRVLAIDDALASKDPSNQARQSTLSARLDVVGTTRKNGGDPKGAITLYERALDIYGTMAAADPGNLDKQRRLATSLNRLARIRLEDEDIASAKPLLQRALPVWEKIVALTEAKEKAGIGKQAGKQTAARLSDMAWIALLVGDFTKSLRSSERAHTLDPDALWIEGNHAHALMLSGQTDEARSVYLTNKGKPLSASDKRIWDVEILKDLVIIRSMGFDNPLMAEIEAALKATGDDDTTP